MFKQDQIKELLNNSNVEKCSSKSITYTKKFKLKAVKQYYDDGYSPNMIFEKAGFNVKALGKYRIKDCLSRWKRIYNNKGKKGLINENRGKGGGRPKVRFKSKDEEIEYLKTKIAYMDVENDFLAKLRGLKRE
jgi:transposase